ncbi:MAG: hypothetical protein EOO18_09125, partial [Chryseobacterium sp.]
MNNTLEPKGCLFSSEHYPKTKRIVTAPRKFIRAKIRGFFPLNLEQFIENHLLQIRKLMSQGDARALLTSVNNYLQIQRQYVRNVMIPAESFAADDPEALEKVTRQNSDFQQKEKIFLIEINNALASTRDDIPAQVDPEMSEDEEEDAAEETEKAEKPAARKGQPRKKLPHEEYDEEHADDEAEGKKSKARSKSKTKSKRGQYEDVD